MPAPSASGFDLLCRNTTIATADRQQTNATTITDLVVGRMPKFIVGPQPVGTSRVFPQPASGTVFTPSSVTDTNGNAVTKSGAEYIDFSSSNNHPLSVGATYLYYDANGTAQNITPHYGSFILQAKHGCSNVSDSPTASGQLLTQLDYP